MGIMLPLEGNAVLEGSAAPAETTCASMPEETGTDSRDATLSGVRASAGRDSSKSLTSSISSMGVMPQMASGENTLKRSATAPTSFPSM